MHGKVPTVVFLKIQIIWNVISIYSQTNLTESCIWL